MGTTYTTKANVYADMASTFFAEYQHFERCYKELTFNRSEEFDAQKYGRLMDYTLNSEKAAIAAVVFQALAIEAYINLFGVSVFGEHFYGLMLGNDKLERANTIKKLKYICNSFGKDYPDTHITALQSLFKKRDKLVHQKPHQYCTEPLPFDYDNPQKSFEPLIKFQEDMMFVFDNLPREMMLYQELQENIRLVRNAENELTVEIHQKYMTDSQGQVKKAIEDMFNVYKDDGNT